jgi:hypothetical protein
MRAEVARNSTLAAHRPLKMFNGIRDVAVRPLDPGFLQGLVQNFASGPDKRLALVVSAAIRFCNP